MSDSNNLFSKNFYQNYKEDSNTFSDKGCLIDESERIPTNLTIAAQIEIQKSIQKQLVNYNIKKSARNATPPYITYTEDELIYLPVMIWIGDSYMAHTDYTDAEYSQLIDWVNEMLAGTYDYVPSESETYNNGAPRSGGAYVAAQNDVNHGIDSGIRLRLMPTVPKHMFNPLFQVAKPFTDNITDRNISFISVPAITSGDVLNMRTGEELPGDWSDHTLNNTTFLEAFERKNYMATRRRSIANLTEDRVGSFTCGPYGTVMRLRNASLASLDVSNLNAYDCYQTFSDGEVYDVYSINHNDTLLSQGPVLHRQINYPSSGVLQNLFNSEGTNMARMIPAMHYFMFYGSSGSQASFPVSNQLDSPLLTISRNGWHMNTNGSKAELSNGGTQDRRDVAATMFHELGHTLGCYHAFHFGHQGYNTSPNSSINFTSTMETDPKGKFLPFINTKKSWYSNADSNIPPFEYTETGYNEDGETVSLLKSYKDLPADEQGYLEMMFNTLPKHLTNNYERKINFNTGSSVYDFYFDHNYPSHFHSAIADSFVGVIQNTSESALKSQLKWKTVLNNYLAMCLGLDSLWGDSYILLDDNGNNVNIESGGKPEFVVNPTTDLIDGMLTTTRDFVWGGGAVGGVQEEEGDLTIENINLINDINEGEFNYDTIRACNYPELGGYAIKKSGNNVLILSDSMQYYVPSIPLVGNGTFPGSNSYHGFTDWFLPSQADYQTFRNIFYKDNDAYLLNNAAPNPDPDGFGNLSLNWGIKKNTFYYMRGSCSEVGTTGTYQLGYTPEGVNAFWFRDNGEGSVAPYYWCTDNRMVSRPDGATASYALPSDVGGSAHNAAFGYLVRTVHVPSAQIVEEELPPVTGGIEVLPANRKGPQITNRVPFCIPVLNESTGLYEPSDIFDPVWFANINWRDPKNRAYPENWPVSKLYDEFDANGDPLCPCLYAEQTVWIDGVERTYTPINASRTGFIPEVQGNISPFAYGGTASQIYARPGEGQSGADWVENEANANSLLNEDAQILYKIQSHSFLKDHPTKVAAGANTERSGYTYNEGAAGFPIESWNNSSMYVDPSNNIQINSSLNSYPINTFVRGESSYRKKLYPSFGCSFNGHQIHNSHLSALAYPHSKGHFFQNYPIGYKPFPGGYSTDTYTSTDPIHYMMAPFGSAYVGINPHGSAYKKFKPDWQNFADEHAASPNTSFSFSGLDYIPSADLTHVIESDLFNTLYFWNGEDDLPTLQYTDSGGRKTSTQLEYVKYTFGSTDLASPYYNPLRLNLFKSSDLTIFRSAGMVDPILSDFSVFYGNTVLDANGEPQTLLNRHSPSIGDINVGILNNTMRYGLNANLIDVAFLEDIDDTCFVLINTKNNRWGCSSNHWKSVPGATGGLHLGRTAMTPGQIFKARAFIENNVGNLQAIRNFGIENNVRASYTEENSFANHIEYCLLKAENPQEYIDEGGLNFDFYDSFFDTSNTTSCDNGHCLESTLITICVDSEGCNNIQTQNIDTQFLPTSDNSFGPKIRCPQNLLHGCYFKADNSICNYIVTTANTNLYCDASGNETTLEICSDLGNNVHASLWLGTSSTAGNLFTSEGETILYGNFYEYEGQLYSNYLETTTKVYYYNPTQITEDEKQKASKKFEKLHKNLTKIVSFAK